MSVVRTLIFGKLFGSLVDGRPTVRMWRKRGAAVHRGLILVAALGALLVVQPASPATTVATSQGRIRAVAHDAGRIAWIGWHRNVVLKNLVTNRQAGLGRSVRFDAGTGWPPHGYDVNMLALAGARAAWLNSRGYGDGECIRSTVRIATPGRSPTTAASFFMCAGQGNVPTDVAGGGSQLAIAWTSLRGSDWSGWEAGPSGGVRVVPTARGAARAPTALIAVAAGRFARVPQERFSDDLWPEIVAAMDGTVRIRDTATGAVVSSFTPLGRVRAVGLSASVAAVLVEAGDDSRAIQRYAVADGHSLGATTVSPLTAPRIDVAGRTIVYRVGHSIWRLDALSGEETLVASPPVQPSFVSIEGARLIWAENRQVDGAIRGRIRMMLVP